MRNQWSLIVCINPFASVFKLSVLCVTQDGSLAESTPLRDRMALYQAAISKQEVPPTSVTVSINANRLPKMMRFTPRGLVLFYRHVFLHKQWWTKYSKATKEKPARAHNFFLNLQTNSAECCLNPYLRSAVKFHRSTNTGVKDVLLCCWTCALVSLRVISWTVSVGSRRKTFLRSLWTWWGVLTCDFSNEYKVLHISVREVVLLSR